MKDTLPPPSTEAYLCFVLSAFGILWGLWSLSTCVNSPTTNCGNLAFGWGFCVMPLAAIGILLGVVFTLVQRLRGKGDLFLKILSTIAIVVVVLFLSPFSSNSHALYPSFVVVLIAYQALAVILFAWRIKETIAG